jgi:hypothetical protein
MEDVTELMAKVTKELGADASDEEISEKLLKTIEALPESDRTQVLEQLVKGVSSGQLRHLDQEAVAGSRVDDDGSAPSTEAAP